MVIRLISSWDIQLWGYQVGSSPTAASDCLRINLDSFVELKDAALINSLEKYFLSAKISEGRKTLIVYQLCTGKATDLVGNFQVQHGANWGHRCYTENRHHRSITATIAHQNIREGKYRKIFKVVSFLNKAIAVGHCR